MEEVAALREVSFPLGAPGNIIKQIITDTFGLNSPDVVLKMRNHRGHLIPLNGSIPANSKHTAHVLEVTRFFQHVRPKPRTIPMTVINRSMKTRLQAVERRIQRLNDLLPQIKLQHNEKLMQEIECLNQKLRFLYRKMQVADSHSWKGALIRAPLW
ncbi:uncharacterized protein si:zfos-1056e6.1 isoform X2 [Cyprinodon tularosa]|uniref:uncharacterized protein si:zfos-1056e6.1 isoform X2 n=1 Tax=Cyprinodon tularosa TaxID=77115 RepID=UPI0018E21B9E|nr:uncharacterized protein si:zfos-1056e6.1 isoform X2 [Cyprinodon tularosa]